MKAIDYKLPVASAQVKTSLLFAGLYADGTTRIEEPIQTRDHGELALQAFGAQVHDRAVKLAYRAREPARPFGLVERVCLARLSISSAR